MKRYSRRRTTRRRPRRAPRRYRKRVSRRIPRSIGAPRATYVKLPYASIQLQNVAASALLNQSFSLNSLFDPDVSGGGGQPLFFDQYAAMYRLYRVYSCKYTCKISVGSNTNNLFHPTLCIVPSADATTYSTIRTAIEIKGSQHRNLVPTAGPQTIKGYYPISSVLGFTKSTIRNDDRVGAAVTTSPPDQAYIHFYLQNNDGASALTVTIEHKLVYYCKFYDLKQVAAS